MDCIKGEVKRLQSFESIVHRGRKKEELMQQLAPSIPIYVKKPIRNSSTGATPKASPSKPLSLSLSQRKQDKKPSE